MPPVQHFGFAAATYGRCRPLYPPFLFQRVLQEVNKRRPTGQKKSSQGTVPRVSAADVGCGSGQFSLGLARHSDRLERDEEGIGDAETGVFVEKVWAIDPSAAQLKQRESTVERVRTQEREEAREGPCSDSLDSEAWVARVEFTEGSSESIPIGDQAVDLLVAAQAAHWFDLGVEPTRIAGSLSAASGPQTGEFWREAARVLAPGGTLALVGYGNCFVRGEESASAIVADHYARVRPFFLDNRAHVDEHYARIVPDPELFRDVVRINGGPSVSDDPDQRIVQQSSLDAFVGYLRTWSGLNDMCEAEKLDPDEVLAKLRAELEATLPGSTVAVEWPLFALFATRR
jgi:SAM-dependent methyltransferase